MSGRDAAHDDEHARPRQGATDPPKRAYNRPLYSTAEILGRRWGEMTAEERAELLARLERAEHTDRARAATRTDPPAPSGQ